MTAATEPAIEVLTHAHPSASVVWLHGLGADGHDFEGIVPQLELGALPVRFVFPHAPFRHVTINNGALMRAWHDVYEISVAAPQDEAGIRESEQLVRALIEREHARGIPYRRIVLAGFSQGGALTLHTALRFPHTLAGILALSTYLPLHTRLRDEMHAANRATPLFMAHGTDDDVVPFELGNVSHELLVTAGFPVEWHVYPMGHAVIPPEIDDIGAWLRRRLA